MHLSLLFTAMLLHSFVSSNFSKGIIVPLLKSKRDDATSIDISAPMLAHSPVLSKFLNGLQCTMILWLATSYNLAVRKITVVFMHCLLSMSQLNILRRGSKVYCGFLDASKAFDKVLHHGILKKLLDKMCL